MKQPCSTAEHAAIVALSKGMATEDQQRRAMQWLVHVAARTYHPSFADNPLQTAFNEGRRSVGLALVELTHLPVQATNDPKN